jgi:hypothetical protein
VATREHLGGDDGGEGTPVAFVHEQHGGPGAVQARAGRIGRAGRAGGRNRRVGVAADMVAVMVGGEAEVSVYGRAAGGEEERGLEEDAAHDGVADEGDPDPAPVGGLGEVGDVL